eukprot:TRINITY_DN103379_c0_g1_i1.p1 TRINITY_DN103379_c0_g1~~TRINITY_DN103379_c0_g1_i1.p1  ORF type:complete len:130 (+),score=22.76 TRINITY_DN103379_c0_g1_i1:35-391(+)
MSMYVRIKRKKQTIFLHCDTTDTPLSLKEKVAQINNMPVENQRLLLGKQLLEDTAQLQEQGVKNDTVLFLVYKEADDKWEEVDITEPEKPTDGSESAPAGDDATSAAGSAAPEQPPAQ